MRSKRPNYLQLQVAEKIEVVGRLDGCNVAAAPKLGSARLGIPTQPNTHTVGEEGGVYACGHFFFESKTSLSSIYSAQCVWSHTIMQQDIGRPKKTLISMSTVYSIYSVTPSICFCVHRKLNHVQSCDHPSIVEDKAQEAETLILSVPWQGHHVRLNTR